MTPWPCIHCGAPGVRNLAMDGFCSTHLAMLYDAFDPAVFKLNGVGLQDGPQRLEWGPTYFDLRCVACGATWVGVPGESCAWCSASLEAMLDWQAELATTPPETDLDDAARTIALQAWAERMWTAVQAGIITERAALAAAEREVKRVA